MGRREQSKKDGSACPIVKLHIGQPECINTSYGGTEPPYRSVADEHKNARHEENGRFPCPMLRSLTLQIYRLFLI